MSEMVERVAQAIFNYHGEQDISWQEWPEELKLPLRDAARSAIAAMRNPSETMMQIGIQSGCGRAHLINAWIGMIDAAIKE